jgi:CheY-like chemotaxis protein
VDDAASKFSNATELIRLSDQTIQLKLTQFARFLDFVVENPDLHLYGTLGVQHNAVRLKGAALMPTVMVVDDVDVIRDVLARLLKREGFDTLAAGSGNEALDMLEHSRDPGHNAPDLILLDVKMPDIDGLDLLEQLHSDSRWKNTPVIMLTALSDTQTVNRAQQLGAKAFLVKATFSVAEMMSCVKQYTRYIAQ